MTFKEAQNLYATKFANLPLEIKYDCYNQIFEILKEKIINNDEYKNILFINKTQMDIDYFSIITEEHPNQQFYMSGLKFSSFTYDYFFNQINEFTDDYEIVNFNYQPKYDAKKWKENKEKINSIDLIILPCQVVDGGMEYAYFANPKLKKFLSKFTKAKIIGIGFDIAKLKDEDFLTQSEEIQLNEFIGVLTFEERKQ